MQEMRAPFVRNLNAILTGHAELLLVAALWFAWLIPGLIGHDPWKPEEATGFGVVFHILQSGDWVVPTVADEPFLARPPLYYLTAAAFARLFSPLLGLPDAARVATGFYMLLTLLFVALSGRELLGQGKGRLASLIFLGSLGLLLRAHELNSDIAGLAGVALALYGLALTQRRAAAGGLLLGTGIGISFLSKGLLMPLGLGATALLLPLLGRDWRRADYGIALQSAVLALLPWVAIWPYALFQHDPELFSQWWSGALAALPGAGDPAHRLHPLYYPKLLSWFAWPALPIALWALWRSRGRWLEQRQILLPLVAFGVPFVLLAFSRDIAQIHALPLLVPLSLLAAEGAGTLRRGAASALDWFGIMTFGLFAAGLWFYWSAMQTGAPARLAAHLARLQPGYTPAFEVPHVTVAALYTLAWLALVVGYRQARERPLVHWAAGMALIWGLLMTLWLPWIDAGKSYLPVAGPLLRALPSKYKCIAGSQIGAAQQVLLEYHVGVTTLRQDKAAARECDVLLVQGTARVEADIGRQWRKVWEGGRPGDNRERFRLYVRRND